MIASLDVESFFTNVPHDETINLIFMRAYHDEPFTPLYITGKYFKTSLVTNAKGAPFDSPKGEMFVQVDGVTMGSARGPCFQIST